MITTSAWAVQSRSSPVESMTNTWGRSRVVGSSAAGWNFERSTTAKPARSSSPFTSARRSAWRGTITGKASGTALRMAAGDPGVLTGMGAGGEDRPGAWAEGIEHLLELRPLRGSRATAGIKLEAAGVMDPLRIHAEGLPDFGVLRFLDGDRIQQGVTPAAPTRRIAGSGARSAATCGR